MKPISADQLLQQIRTLHAELNATPPSRPEAAQGTQGPGFGEVLKSSLDAVNELQQDSSSLKHGFVQGSGDASLVQVMVAAQKADLSFRAMTQVRNKLVAAYQEIMNMPV